MLKMQAALNEITRGNKNRIYKSAKSQLDLNVHVPGFEG
jgi:hypothetical protein